MPQNSFTLADDQFNLAGASARLRAQELEAWIETLPLADVGETHHRVVSALSKLNDSELSGQERFEALELFRRPIRYLYDATRNHFLGKAFPLTPRARGVAAQLFDLNSEMAKGYQSISDELLDLNTLRQDFTMLAASLQRTLYYLGQDLLTGYLVYESCSAGCWRRIHLIYDTAERKGVHASTVKDPYGRINQETTVEDQYKQLLLLALANPYRYSHAEMNWIYTSLEQWTPLCHLHSADSLDELQFACLVDLANDAGPCYIAYSTAPHPATCRFLNTSTLVQSLRNSIAGYPSGFSKQTTESGPAQTSANGRTLLPSLTKSWALTSKRKYSRMQPDAKNIEISLSLSAVHRLIDNLDSRQGGDDGDAPPRPTVVHMGRLTSTSLDGGGPYLCEVIDESANGSRLRWQNANKGKIHVGELVAIRRSDESAEMPGIAVIRWLKITNNHTVEFGIQMLSPDAFPITIRHYDGENQEAGHDYLKGLYVPEFKTTSQPASLLLPAFLYHTDDIISLVMDHQEHRVKLIKAVETTPGFSRFLFSSMPAPQDRH